MSKIILNKKSVIFDLDGVITNTMPEHLEAWQTILTPLGFVMNQKGVYLSEGQPGEIFLYEFFEKHKRTVTHNEIKEILFAKEEHFRKIVKLRFISGSKTFLKKVHKIGFKLALVTGTSHRELLQYLPEELYNLFSVIVTGCRVQYGKPNPEPYLKAIEELKIKKADAVVIENAPFGIGSAKGAGLECIALETSLSKEYLFKADHIFKSFKELEKTISFKLKQ